MKIGIYSPRKDVRQQAEQGVGEFVSSAYLSVDYQSYSSLEALSLSLSSTPIDLLFFDIEQPSPPPPAPHLPEETSAQTKSTSIPHLTLAEELQDVDFGQLEEKVWQVMRTIPGCGLILMANDTRHAMFGYAVQAINYVTTPLDQEEFVSVIAGVVRRRVQATQQYLPIKLNGIWSQVDTDHITHIESEGHSLFFHMSSGNSLKTFSGFRDFDVALESNPNFFRCHKSYMVNMKYVSSMEQTSFLLHDGTSINISRPYRQEARSVLTSYITNRQLTDKVASLDIPLPAPVKEPPPPQKVAPTRIPASPIKGGKHL